MNTFIINLKDPGRGLPLRPVPRALSHFLPGTFLKNSQPMEI